MKQSEEKQKEADPNQKDIHQDLKQDSIGEQSMKNDDDGEIMVQEMQGHNQMQDDHVTVP